jgi:hypothetical protein
VRAADCRAATASAFFWPRTSGTTTSFCHTEPLSQTSARGTAALLAREPAAARADLGAVHEHTEREGVADPGVFPVAPERVEALAELVTSTAPVP